MVDMRMRGVIQDILNEASENPQMRMNVIRLEADAKLAEEAGFALPPPIYSLGTPVNQVGVDNFRSSRVEWEKLPDAKTAAKTARALLMSEERRDIVSSPSAVWAHRNGNLGIVDQGDFKITKSALQQLAGFVSPKGSYAGSYFSAIDPDQRAYNLNKHLTNPRSSKPLKFRVRKDGDDSVIFAVVGQNFPDYDAIKLLADLEEGLDERAHGTFLYSGDGGRMIFDATYHSDIQPEDAAAGEIFRVGVRATTADDGTQSYKLSMIAERNLCLNFIIIGKDEVTFFRGTHRGDVERIRENLRSAISTSVARLDGFAKKWSHARRTVVPASTQDQMVQVYQGLINAKYLKVTGKNIAEGFASAWTHEPGTDMSSVVNGITRYAKDRSWTPSQWADSSEIESAAGDLLYAKVNWNKVLG